jgi:DegV family protein with EDD domain
MREIAIFTDSSADLDREYREQHNILSIAHYVRFEYEFYLDGITLDTDDLYHRIKETHKLPTTSPATDEDYMMNFERYLDFDYDILYIGVGSKFSLAFQNALMAQQEIDVKRIFVIDSNSLSSGIGILVCKAAKMRDQGYSIQKIYKEILALVPRVQSHFALRTTDYLLKSGRANHLMNIYTKLFFIKPLIKLEQGELVLYKKLFGSMRRAIREMLQELFENMIYVDTDFIMVTHSLANKEILYMIELIKKRMPNAHIVENKAGCVISIHCGPGAVGLTYIKG